LRNIINKSWIYYSKK